VALLDQLELADVTVVDNSIGGWIAAEMAILGSARVSSYVLVDAVADFFSPTPAELAERSYYDPVRTALPGSRRRRHGRSPGRRSGRLRPRRSAPAAPRRGLVERHPDAGDGRRVFMSLTEDGRQAVHSKRSTRTRQLGEAPTRKFTPDEL
jgi:pimeloyl-ACP methyl ester carboxylesterase